MRYRIEYTARAERDLEAAHAWIAADAPLAADRWLTGFDRAVARLSTLPGRCPPAQESEPLGVDLRQLIFGGYRIIFQITGRVVVILHIRHARRLPAARSDLY